MRTIGLRIFQHHSLCFLLMILAFFAAACEGLDSSLSREYSDSVKEQARLHSEVTQLEARIAELERDLQVLNESKKKAENEKEEWKVRAGELELLVQDLQPTILPAFQSDDLKNNTLVLRRVFSIRTEQCFDRAGVPSCLVAELDTEEGGGYVIYKANRTFDTGGQIPSLHNSYGEELKLVTKSLADKIRAWESENPHNSIRLGAY
ncbi:MAG: hypothetical protein GY719_14500 [bacterium]|nr:hypothetical protein [bacterium]